MDLYGCHVVLAALFNYNCVFVPGHIYFDHQSVKLVSYLFFSLSLLLVLRQISVSIIFYSDLLDKGLDYRVYPI